jgi:hypothetical protein
MLVSLVLKSRQDPDFPSGLNDELSLGGLGVHDMEWAGLALRLRWLWYSKTGQDRAWSGLELPNFK